jgi:hypothetical protein
MVSYVVNRRGAAAITRHIELIYFIVFIGDKILETVLLGEILRID